MRGFAYTQAIEPTPVRFASEKRVVRRSSIREAEDARPL